MSGHAERHTDVPQGGGRGPSTIDVTWDGGDTDRVELARWIATGGDVLAPLLDPKVFKTAHVGEYGAHIAWGG